jgi:hypothetical protein
MKRNVFISLLYSIAFGVSGCILKLNEWKRVGDIVLAGAILSTIVFVGCLVALMQQNKRNV